MTTSHTVLLSAKLIFARGFKYAGIFHIYCNGRRLCRPNSKPLETPHEVEELTDLDAFCPACHRLGMRLGILGIRWRDGEGLVRLNLHKTW